MMGWAMQLALSAKALKPARKKGTVLALLLKSARHRLGFVGLRWTSARQLVSSMLVTVAA